MKRLFSVLLAVVVLAVITAPTALAATADEMLLYMGIKILYVWRDPNPGSSGGQNSGPIIGGTIPGNTFTTKDTPELIAQALSNNHPSLTVGFARQMPMRDLMNILNTVKSAADILEERGREDLLALAWLGGYTAPEREVIVIESDDGGVELIDVPTHEEIPSWAMGGDLGQLGDGMQLPLGSRVNLISVYGATFTPPTGNQYFGLSETVFDTTRGETVYSLLNGYVSYVSTEASTVTITSYDQRVAITYKGVVPSASCTVGKVFSQRDSIGSTDGYYLGVELSIDGTVRNVLQLYSEESSMQWFRGWEQRQGADAVNNLILGPGDTNWHITANRLSITDPYSYLNPEDYGIDPRNPPPDPVEGEVNEFGGNP